METLTITPEVEEPVTTLTEKEFYRLCCNRWKEVCELFCRKLGFEVDEMAEMNQRFFLKKKGDNTILAYAKCFKQWNREITVADLSGLEKRMKMMGVENGIIFTRSGFSRDALDFAKGKSFDLITVRVLLNDILKLKAEDIREMESLARKIVFLAPCCPQCRKVMIHASNQVGGFWRCSKYPRCNVTYMN